MTDTIRDWREANGVTQKQFAKNCKKSQSWVSKIEREGLPDKLSSLELIAKNMGMTRDELLEGIDA